MTPKKASTELPQFLRDMLASPPRHGHGVHVWLYRMARQLHAHRDEVDIFALLTAAVSECGRIVTEREVLDAVRNAKATAWSSCQGMIRTPARRPPTWPAMNVEQREAVLREMDGFGLVDLWQVSPQRWDDKEAHTNEIVGTIFPPDCLLCAGQSQMDAKTKPLAQWLAGDMSHLQFIVPSPMNKTKGINKEGRVSGRCLDNTGERRFLIVEADHGTIDEQASILAWLARKAPLTLAVHSGGKSLHGWFFCGGANDEKLSAFFRMACLLGADFMLWTRCQLVRVPDGLRPADPGKERRKARQAVYFFNPETCQ